MRFSKYKVGDISTVSAGGDRPSICSDKKTKETPVPIFSNGIENEGLYGYTNQAKIEGDTVTVSARGVNIGTVCYRSESFMPIVRLLSLVPNREIVDAKYLYYYLKNTHISGTGSAQPQVTIPMISNLEIVIHKDLTEQKKIADLLSSFDKKIKANNQINRNLVEQILTIYRSWFISFEQFSDTLEEGELGSQPTGWKVVPLKEVTINIRDRVKGDVDSVKVLSAVNTGKLILSEEYFTKQVFSKDIGNYILVEKNDFAYNPARVNIGSIGINDLGIRGCVSPVYVVIRTEKGYENFLRYFLNTERFKTEVITRASGSVRQAMNYTDFGLIKVIYPPKEVVKEFNEIISPLQIAIKHNELQNVNLTEQRDTLLPQLMSGELDVSDLHI